MKPQNELAEFLRKKREEANLTQKQVSDKLGYSTPQFVSNWERGISCPPIKTAKKLADLYKVSQDQMFEVVRDTSINKLSLDLKKKFYGKKAAQGSRLA